MKELIAHRTLLPAFERFAERVGFHDGDYHGTFGQHGDRVLRLADAMHSELGLNRGDRFAVMSCNSHQYFELYHAGFLGAGLINPLNLRLAGKELQFILADSGSEVVFVDSVFAEHFLRNIAEVRDQLPLRHVVVIGDADVPHDVAYEDLIEAGRPVVPEEPEEDDPVVLMYTGGTTGLPKGVLLDQRAEILNLYHIGLDVSFDDTRVYLHQTPMFHAASMAAILGIPGGGGQSVVVPMFDPGPVMALIEQYQVNWTTMVPTMIAMVLDHPEFRPERLASLTDLVYGASPMPAGLLDRITSMLPGTGIWQGYGMTECSSVLTFLTAKDHEIGGPRLRSAGRPMIGIDLTIQDENGKQLPPGEDGEVCARAGNFMQRYWNRPDETDDAFRGGWYHTGDEGHTRCRRLRVPRRPGEGHDRHRRRERVLDRGRERHLDAPGRRAGRSDRHPAPHMGRAGARDRRAPTGQRGDGRRAAATMPACPSPTTRCRSRSSSAPSPSRCPGR